MEQAKSVTTRQQAERDIAASQSERRAKGNAAFLRYGELSSRSPSAGGRPLANSVPENGHRVTAPLTSMGSGPARRDDPAAP
jgi:hypothetical protein